MKIYTLSEQGIAKLKWRFIQRMSIIGLILFCIMIAVNYGQAKDHWLILLIGSMVMCIGVTGFVISRQLPHNKAIWESIKVELGDDYIGRSQLRIPQVRLNRRDITSIEENQAGLCIYTANELRNLFVPNDLDQADYQEIKSILANWVTIQPKSTNSQLQYIVAMIISIVAFGILFISSSIWVVLITGMLLVGHYGYIYWTIERAEGIDPQYKKVIRFAFVFPLFIMSFKICVLLGGLDVLLG